MAYVNPIKQISQYVADNWSATPVVYVNAPQPEIPSTGQYAGCYVRIYGSSAAMQVELSESKRRIDEGVARFDIHVPADSSYLLSDSLLQQALPMFDNEYEGGVKFYATGASPDAGYFNDGTHVARIELEYLTDYELV